jgi:biopolymer transport protein ExbB/TolQ
VSTLKGIGIAVLAVVALIGLIIAGIYISGTISKKTANFRGDVGVKNKTLADPNYRIANYNHFFDLCASVQAREAAISNAKEEEKHATQARQMQLEGVITANRNERAELIAQYNADASKSYTQAQFLSSDLPYRLDQNAEETQCTA